MRLFAAHPVEKYRRGMLEFATSVPDLIGPFRRLDIPVLGVCGELDPFPDKPVVLEGMKGFREAPPIQGACRFVQWERPEAFNSLLRDFLLECHLAQRA